MTTLVDPHFKTHYTKDDKVQAVISKAYHKLTRLSDKKPLVGYK